jgi:hypothetical protein
VDDEQTVNGLSGRSLNGVVMVVFPLSGDHDLIIAAFLASNISVESGKFEPFSQPRGLPRPAIQPHTA